MSEQTKIFRGDHAPEAGQVDAFAPELNTPAPVPVAATAADAPKAEPKADATKADASKTDVPAPASQAAPPPLDFHLDDSQLFHTPEAVRQRMAQLASAAHATAHLLDKQAGDSERIAQRLRSL